jgi:hypothetical protein
MIMKRIIRAKTAVFSVVEISLYELVLKNIGVRKCEKVEEFEREYLMKMVINLIK